MIILLSGIFAFIYYISRLTWFRYLIKYCLFWLLIQLRKRQRNNSNENNAAGYGVKSYANENVMDSIQKLDPSHPLAVDAVYFNGGNVNKDYAVFAVARRQKGIRQCIIIVRINGLGLFMHPLHPQTNFNENENEEKSNCFSGGGIKLTVSKPMKEWIIEWSGELRFQSCNGDESSRLVNVNLSFTWTSEYKLFDFDTDQSVALLCDAVARQPWSRQMFDNLKKLHQTHYEQFGEMKGEISIEGFGKRSIALQGVRDHSYGNYRDWHDLRRYGLQYIHTIDGQCIAVGCICMPRHLNRLKIGYICDRKGNLSALCKSNFILTNLGENGDPPKQWTISCQSENGEKFSIEGQELDRCFIHMGFEEECKVFERFCSFTVNGKSAWGISEWNYLRKDFNC